MDGKIMKKILLIFLSLFIFKAFAFDISECYKIYPKDANELYLNAISAINSSGKYKISELQAKNGYILFLYGTKYYLLTVTKRYQNQTEIKILPQNSEYTQGSTVAKEIFSLIDLKYNNSPMELIR